MPEVMLNVPDYDPARGMVIVPEGGDILVRHGESGAEILADPAGLRDLARWCLWQMSTRPMVHTSTSIREPCR
jgi:hypothetical protein